LITSLTANNAYLSSDSEPGAEVLVTVLNHPRDLAIARDQHWYRIPVANADKWVGRRWPPEVVRRLNAPSI
jgi:hypothetical protein